MLGTLFLGACSGPAPSSDTGKSEPKTEESRSRVYHVQLQLTEKKDQAEAIMSRGLQWWENQPTASRPPLAQDAPSSGRAVSITWKAPLYRVRIGPFATEQQAQSVLEAARPTFPDAFVAPERVQNP